ncbi:MAG: ribonuclease P protein component [Alphaproteobacteria bacterium]
MENVVGRIKRRPDFLRVAGKGRKWAALGLVLQAARCRTAEATTPSCLKNEDTPDIRVGFTASRKVGMAVARNRARRRLRSVAARVLPTKAQPGFDYVIIARKATLARSFSALLGDLDQALAHVGAHRERPVPPRSGRRRPRRSGG